ncbi:MAG: hypothetical protein V4508_04735 [Pseudomonadota bacterium]
MRRTAAKRFGFPGAGAALAALACLSAAPVYAAPSTFGPVIGNAILCRSHLDNAYFYSYLAAAFGPAYKHEGGAYWFKADGTLWGNAVTEVMVSDDSSELVFIGAVADATPEQVDESIRGALGLRHVAIGASAFPVREAGPGSRIVYFKDKAKIYCARFKPLPSGR